MTTSWAALALICVSHFCVDRWRLTRYIVWFKNRLSPEGYPQWRFCASTGYFDSSFSTHADLAKQFSQPQWLSTWLYIIADNTVHLIFNALAVGCL